MSDFVEINNSSTIGQSGPENVSGSLMGGEPLKLILLSAMFSLSILVRSPDYTSSGLDPFSEQVF